MALHMCTPNIIVKGHDYMENGENVYNGRGSVIFSNSSRKIRHKF